MKDPLISAAVKERRGYRKRAAEMRLGGVSRISGVWLKHMREASRCHAVIVKCKTTLRYLRSLRRAVRPRRRVQCSQGCQWSVLVPRTIDALLLHCPYCSSPTKYL